MRIGELSRRSGVSRDSIRFYERAGLLREAPRPHETNSYKAYDSLALRRLGLIQHAKGLGFTLREIAEVIDAWEGEQFSLAEKVDRLQRKIEDVDAKARALAELRAELVAALAAVETGCSHDGEGAA